MRKPGLWPLAIVICLFLPLVTTTCDGGGGSSGNGAKESASDDPIPGSYTGEIDTGNMLALVLDAQGGPVRGAVVGDAAATTSAGVAAGTLTVPASGWVKVTAPGYAPNYVRKEGRLEGRDIFEATLTPVATSALHEYGSDTAVSDDPKQPSVSLSLPSGLFESSVVTVELARIEPANLGPVFAGNDYDDTLGILVAFSVEATDASSGGDAVFASGQTAQVTIVDNGQAGESPLLASFDAETGLWEVSPNACVRLDGVSIRCDMEHFSLNATMRNGRSVTASGEYDQARADLEKAVDDWAAEGGGEPVPDNVMQALERMADAAMAYANLNPTETAKQRLFSVAARAQLLGRMDISDTVCQKAADVTEQIAQALLADPDCGKLKELLGAAAQCQVVGLDDLSQELIQKARDLLGACNVWAGTVNFVFLLDDPYPFMEDYRHHSGPMTWQEKHSLTLAVHPETYGVDGEDTVSLSMPQVAFRIDDGSHECGEDYVERKNWVTGDRIDLSMDGSFSRDNDRPNFTFTAMSKDSGSVSFSASDLVHYWASNHAA